MKKLIIIGAVGAVVGVTALPFPAHAERNFLKQLRNEFNQKFQPKSSELNVSVTPTEIPSVTPSESITPSTSVTPSITVSVTPKKKKDRDNDKDDDKNKSKLSAIARLAKAKVTAVNGSTLTVNINGTTYTVNTDSHTRCVRHFWGKCNVSEILVNDELSIWGRFTDSTKTTIQALLIRDLSIEKRYGAFIGDVVSKNGNTFVIKSKERGSQTVTVSTSTKFIDRTEKKMSYTDVAVGHRVRVKGVWDKANNVVNEVREVKDFTFPVKAKVNPSVTPSVSPSVSPSVTPSVSPSVSPTATPSPTNTPTPTP